MRKIKYNKFGLAEDPRGLQIKMTYNDYALLGDVIDCYRDEVTGSWKLIVQHFNGEPWPICPVANLVEVFDAEDMANTRQDMVNEAHYAR